MITILMTRPDDRVLLRQLLYAALVRIELRRLIIPALQRNRCGRRLEKPNAVAVQQGTEEPEQAVAEPAAELEAALSPMTPPKQDGSACRPRIGPAKCCRGAPQAGLAAGRAGD